MMKDQMLDIYFQLLLANKDCVIQNLQEITRTSTQR